MDIKEWLINNKIMFKELKNGEIHVYNSKSGNCIARIFCNENKYVIDIKMEDEKYDIENFKSEILEVLAKL